MPDDLGSSSATPSTGVEQVRALAHVFIPTALSALTKGRVVPTSHYRSFLHVSRDCAGSDLMFMPEFAQTNPTAAATRINASFFFIVPCLPLVQPRGWRPW